MKVKAAETEAKKGRRYGDYLFERDGFSAKYPNSIFFPSTDNHFSEKIVILLNTLL